MPTVVIEFGGTAVSIMAPGFITLMKVVLAFLARFDCPLICARPLGETLIVTVVRESCSTVPVKGRNKAAPSLSLRSATRNVDASTVSSNVRMISRGSSISLSSNPTSPGGVVSGV